MKSSMVVLCALFIQIAAGSEVPDGMVLIPGTEYQMGTDESELPLLAELGREVPHMNLDHAIWWFGNEVPLHPVSLDSFCIDINEVTNAEFRQFTRETGYTPEGDWERFAGEGHEDYPVVNVSWFDARAYAAWTGKRLPTEEEWEYACAGGIDHLLFYWGNEPEPEMANYRSQGESFLAGLGRLMGFRSFGATPVGSYPPNGYGLFDMLGNVSEWVDGEYRPYPGASGELVSWCENDPDFTRRVVRGGSWETPNAVFLRTTARSGFDADYYSWETGFRCAKSI